MAQFALALATSFAVVSCGSEDDARATAQSPTELVTPTGPSPSQMFDLDPDARSRHEAAALDGDPDAAFLIYQHYVNQELWDESEKWLRIGAENGNPHLVELLGRNLWQAGGRSNCRRAAFWLRNTLARAQASGDEIKLQSMREILAEVESNSGRCK